MTTNQGTSPTLARKGVCLSGDAPDPGLNAVISHARSRAYERDHLRSAPC